MSQHFITLTLEQDDIASVDCQRANRERGKDTAPITVSDLITGVVLSWIEAKRVEQRKDRDQNIQLAFDSATPGAQEVVLQALGIIPRRPGDLAGD